MAFLTQILLVLIICIRDYEIYLRSLICHKMGRLLVQEFFDLLILKLVEYSLQKLLQFILTHDRLRHDDECNFGCLPNILARVLKILGKLDQQFVVLVEEKNIITKLSNNGLQTLAHLQSGHIRFSVQVLHLEYL